MKKVHSKVFIIRSENPLDMEGSSEIESVFFNEEKADNECAYLNADSIAVAKFTWGERYQKFAFTYTVESWNVKDA